MRYSVQREIILNDVQNRCDHPTAEMIYDSVKAEIPNISMGTVYRNLNHLVEEKLVKEIPVVNGRTRFDKTLCHHSHFKCEKCGKVFDVESLNLVDLNDKVENLTGNKVQFSELLFVGVCKECLEKHY